MSRIPGRLIWTVAVFAMTLKPAGFVSSAEPETTNGGAGVVRFETLSPPPLSLTAADPASSNERSVETLPTTREPAGRVVLFRLLADENSDSQAGSKGESSEVGGSLKPADCTAPKLPWAGCRPTDPCVPGLSTDPQDLTQAPPSSLTVQQPVSFQQAGAPPFIGDFFGVGGTRSVTLQPFVGQAVIDVPGNTLHQFSQAAAIPAPPGALTGTFYVANSPAFIPATRVTAGLQNIASMQGFTGFPGAAALIDGTSFEARDTGNTVDFVDSSGMSGTSDVYDVFENVFITLPLNTAEAAAAGVGRVKLSEGSSPLPRDRVFFHYSLFHNTRLFGGDIDVHRFTPGFEKTLFNGQASIELRTPFASTLDGDLITGNGFTNSQTIEVGNAALAFKGMLYQDSAWVVSAGVQITIPTADDLHIADANARELIRIENESPHVNPFFGWMYTPTDRFFVQSFLQGEFDTVGNPVQTNLAAAAPSLGLGTTGFQDNGRLNVPSFLYFDASMGYWVYRDRSANPSTITGFAPRVEVHYSSQVSDGDTVSSPLGVIGNDNNNLDVVNLTLGATLELGNATYFQMGYIVPIGGVDDRSFDGELRCLFSHRFGSATRQSTAF